MSAKKREKLAIHQRIFRLILGKEKPNFITRVSVGIGFLIWVYLLSWHILTFMAIILMDTLKQGDKLQDAFIRKGSELYHYANTISLLTYHTLFEFVAFTIVLLGLILIWRRKRIGFLFFVFGMVSIPLITIFILGMEYFLAETPIFELILYGSTTLYFGIGALWFYKWKDRNKEDPNKPDKNEYKSAS